MVTSRLAAAAERLLATSPASFHTVTAGCRLSN